MVPSTMDTQWLLDALKQPVQQHKERLIATCSGVEWAGLISFADYHGITPLLCRQLQEDAELWSRIPTAAQEQLQQRYLDSVRRNLLIYQHFLKFIKMLQKLDIPVILLKGAFLAHVVYRDHALRPMVDVDILVREGDILRTEEVLVALGYELKEWKHREWCLKHHYHLSYVHPTIHVTIEVHWHVQRPEASYRVPIEELWSQTQPVTIAGVELLGLSIEHLLLHISLHNAKHGFGVGLRPFCDLAALLMRHKEQIEWKRVQAEAERWQITKAVYLSLYFTHDFFDCVPDHILTLFDPGNVDAGILAVARDQVLSFGRARARLSPAFLELWEAKPNQNKFTGLLQRVFLPPDVMASIYNLSPDSKRVYLAYPLRVFDLLVRYPAIVQKMVRKDEATLDWAKQSNSVDALRQWLAG